MVSIHNLILACSALASLALAAPADIASRQAFVPGTLNTTREFYVTMQVIKGVHMRKYNGWQIVTYHTGAGLADPVFNVTGTRAFLNNTQLQFDAGSFPFSLIASVGDTNYARWEPTSVRAGYGTSGFVDAGSKGIITNDAEFGGWLVCEWFHGTNLPQLFQLIKGFNTPEFGYPATCATVKLVAKWV
ncbi:hypothetical protein B2J93_7651 [Marssonina coronariae]|uniref:DUF7907 domain-containing protein n=1 Tax=Diplocarpon coronariae TaxID=2795749 RepID=A0A218ZCX1_9HELO|nr:hypothetical protein B2J93_7651 [Marssonina coronariae]